MKINVLIGLSLTALLLWACDKPAASTAAAQQAAPPEVGVVAVATAPLALSTELPGRVSALMVSEVRPQVGGIVLKRLFVEGADVTEGQVLYQIDPATYQAELASAKANLAKAKATATSLRSKAQRYKELVAINAVAKQDYDDAVASMDAANADIAADAAAVDSAQINLDYTAVKAPISGRIGKSSVTPGALVTASQTTALATIQQLDQVYVDVTQSSIEFLRLKRDLAAGKIVGAGADRAKAKLTLEDGSPYAEAGILQFSDVTVDEGTGSITLRAVFPNPDHDLLPGMYVRASLETGTLDNAILVPQAGVTRDPKGQATALVVGAEDKVEQRIVTTDRAIGDQWLVTDGLKAGDRLIVDGLQKIAVGMVVKPVAPAAKSAGTS
ncbi:efflux RND transporter periplasmic adaptor subunit [Dongia sedimenti]|uniref:Efflux RND transporter periplasmic adaptor subunit n=1 Tax=Dongia sedimenti TaxID=3064282 RepID=A0ABU0YLF4_9PROT|nr:efflux RND transporter periplasmic adaptor subunit [Rhodospirillaceae bacterium R-7]